MAEPARDSCMELHGDAIMAAGAGQKVWSTSAPLPGAAPGAAGAAPPGGAPAAPPPGGGGGGLEDALAQHMLLLDLEDLEYDEGGAGGAGGAPTPGPSARALSGSGAPPGASPLPGASPPRRVSGSPPHGGGALGSAEALAARQQRSAPLAPTGFTPAEVGVGW
jgi:hypothetical protein